MIAALTATITAVAGLAHADTSDELLPHPGPEGVLWIPSMTGDNAAVSSGLDGRKPTTVTVACLGGGELTVTVEPASVSFPVTCPADTVTTEARTIDAGMSGSFSVAIDTSAPTIRWGLTVTQPD